METGAITGYIDVAQVVLYAFWLFFAGLILYLLREGRREGYPLVSERDGSFKDHGLWLPDPKTFVLEDGTRVSVPILEKDIRDLPLAAPIGPSGMPFTATGDALMDGVGPGAYTPRFNRPDVTHHGDARIVPLRTVPDIFLEERDYDPRGMTVIGADWEEAGTVVDVWVDRAEFVIRYFEVELASSFRAPAAAPGEGRTPVMPRTVLLPVNFAQINAVGRRMKVDAILASQFAGVPGLDIPELVTLNEEDRICAYYGGGYMYATPMRQESLL